MIECAVFLAIFLPAALVEDGCFLFVLCLGGDCDASDEVVEDELLGFIWMIFLARLGGGGRSVCRSSFFAPDRVRL